TAGQIQLAETRTRLPRGREPLGPHDLREAGTTAGVTQVTEPPQRPTPEQIDEPPRAALVPREGECSESTDVRGSRQRANLFGLERVRAQVEITEVCQVRVVEDVHGPLRPEVAPHEFEAQVGEFPHPPACDQP